MSARLRKQPKENGWYLMGMPGYHWFLIWIEDGKYSHGKDNFGDPRFTFDLADRPIPEKDVFYGPIKLPEGKREKA